MPRNYVPSARPEHLGMQGLRTEAGRMAETERGKEDNGMKKAVLFEAFYEQIYVPLRQSVA